MTDWHKEYHNGIKTENITTEKVLQKEYHRPWRSVSAARQKLEKVFDAIVDGLESARELRESVHLGRELLKHVGSASRPLGGPGRSIRTVSMVGR